MTTRPAPADRARQAGLLTALGATLLLGGCAITNPVQTDVSYSASDGVNIDAGDILVRGLAVVAESQGGQGTLVGQVVNTGRTEAEVTFASKGGSVKTTVKPGESVALSMGGKKLTLPVEAAPGQTTMVSVAAGGSVGNPASVPVLPRTDYYTDL